MKMRLLIMLFLLQAVLVAMLPLASWAEGPAVENPPPQAASTPDSPGQTPAAAGSDEAAKIVVIDGAFLRQWLHMLDSDIGDDAAQSSVLTYASRVPEDLARILQSTGGGKDRPGFLGVLWRSLLAIVIGFFISVIIRKVAQPRFARFDILAPDEQGGFALLGVGILQSLPSIIALLLFAVSAALIFLGLAADIGIKGRMFFQALLGTILVFMVCSIIGRIIFSPDDAGKRPVRLHESLIKPLYRTFYVSFAVMLSGMLIINLVRELGARPQTLTWVVIVLGSVVIAIYAYLIFYLKKPVADALLVQLEKGEGGWFKKQLASHWHVAGLVYLLFIWFIWLGQQLTGTSKQNGAFIISMLIVPIYLVLSHSGKFLIEAVVESLHLGQVDAEEREALAAQEVLALEQSRRQVIAARTSRVFRIILVGVLTIWLLSYWGLYIPFAQAAVRAVFESLVALALALLCWRFASQFIERKLDEGRIETEAVVDDVDDVDDEFGGAVQRGRNYTLLPMVRKVIGSVLVVMVILIIISSLGVNIAPLLAGAGVIGLAVGFGAQKLVSDVLSGFFFLLDDAFRVGEYIQTGSIRGTVESITLRNVMLRHHLGMLQVVPHSDLGAVTNYMRGGIVIKFPLEFPYDTDIDLVRKIIKKVGIAMLEDEEIADDFILPLKSQGVHEITNSVMVIRVKFTAKPGKQFVIKREAFRRISEALAAKGIHYAHRKVIVDFPEDTKMDKSDPKNRLKALEAGAAAVVSEMEKPAEENPQS